MTFSKKNVLIIGYGSIGQRHSEILLDMGVNVSIFSRRNIDHKLSFDNLKNAIKKTEYDYVIIANRTSEHFSTLEELKELNYNGVVLIEKPMFETFKKFNSCSFKKIIVAYNMRFIPVIQELKKSLKMQKILSVNVYAGQYLPDWRPNTDYRKSYSASKIKGGGVLLDLSHEVDYLNWILEGCNEVIAVGGKYSNLEIDSYDIFQISLKTSRCDLVQLELNYLDRVLRRYIIVNTNEHTYKADLIKSTLEVDGKIYHYENYRNYSYEIQHELILSNNYANLCSYEEAIEDMKLLDSIKKSNEVNAWVKII